MSSFIDDILPTTLPDDDPEREAIMGVEAEAEAASNPLNSLPPESFPARYCDYASQRTDAPLVAHEAVALGIMSALAGPKPRLPISTSIHGWSLVVWMLYIVNSTVGRKSSVIDYGSDIIHEVLGPDAVLHWEGSPQGILQRLQTRDGQSTVFLRDEYSGLLHQMNRAGGHMAGLPQLFIRAYDGRTLENIRTKKKNQQTGEYEDDTDRVQQPYLVKLCASTWDSFISRATIDNVLDGFLARFVVVTGAAEPREMQQATPALAALRLSLIEHAKEFHQKANLTEQIEIEDGVLHSAFLLEQEWNLKAQNSSRPDAAGPALKRLAKSVFKTAALFAIDDAVIGGRQG